MTKLFTIYDKKAKTYQDLYLFANEAVALRNLGEMANDDKYTLKKFPDDYSIYCVGLFDESTGTISGIEEPELLVEVKNLIREKKSG